jgi:peptidoglycan/LPS O-acetylase OafA/YrhL
MAQHEQSAKNTNSSSYDPGIDVIRFFAFFFVFFTHFVNKGGNGIQVNEGQWWNNQAIQRFADFGGQGVTLFFGLTGFLLGRLLIQEFKDNGTISVKSFYLRRILRIWPLYFAFIILCGVFNLFANSPTLTKAELPYLATFTYNWGQVFGAVPGTMATITWSISVEEQIYLFFPLFFLLLVKSSAKKYAWILTLAGLFNVVACLYLWNINPNRFTPAFLLPVGIGLLSAHYEEKFPQSKKALWKSLLLTSLILVYIFAFQDIASSFKVVVYCGSALLLPGLLYLVRSSNIEQGNILVRAAVFIGRRSYGCYLFHWAVWTVMVGRHVFSTDIGGFSIIGVVVGFIATIAISAFSYRFFESPFLTYRKRFQRVLSP